MIKYQKTNPVGIDYFINTLQILQQRDFPSLFEVNESTCDFYGRAEKIEEIISVYAEGKKYVPIGFDTKLNFVSYIEIANTYESDNQRDIVDASYYCHGNLENIFSSVTHRADEEFRLAMKDFILSQIEPQFLISTELIDTELQPFHSFKINFKINF